jgi:hypothetical protein
MKAKQGNMSSLDNTLPPRLEGKGTYSLLTKCFGEILARKKASQALMTYIC